MLKKQIKVSFYYMYRNGSTDTLNMIVRKGAFVLATFLSWMCIKKLYQAAAVVVDDWLYESRKKTMNQLVLQGNRSKSFHAEPGQLVTGAQPGREDDDGDHIDSIDGYGALLNTFSAYLLSNRHNNKVLGQHSTYNHKMRKVSEYLQYQVQQSISAQANIIS